MTESGPLMLRKRYRAPYLVLVAGAGAALALWTSFDAGPSGAAHQNGSLIIATWVAILMPAAWLLQLKLHSLWRSLPCFLVGGPCVMQWPVNTTSLLVKAASLAGVVWLCLFSTAGGRHDRG